MGAGTGRRVHRRSRKFYRALTADLLDHARHQFGLSRRLPDGTSRRDHYDAVERQTGRRPPALDGPALPSAVEHLWDWFVELNAARGSTGFGPAPLGYAEIRAWAALTDRQPSPWEVETLKTLDEAWLASLADSASKTPAPIA